MSNESNASTAGCFISILSINTRENAPKMNSIQVWTLGLGSSTKRDVIREVLHLVFVNSSFFFT